MNDRSYLIDGLQCYLITLLFVSVEVDVSFTTCFKRVQDGSVSVTDNFIMKQLPIYVELGRHRIVFFLNSNIYIYIYIKVKLKWPHNIF